MEPTANDVKNTATDAKSMASDKASKLSAKASDIASQVSSRVSETLGSSQAQVEDAYHMARETASEYVETSADFVRRYPLYTLAGVAAVGFIAGSLMSRSKR